MGKFDYLFRDDVCRWATQGSCESSGLRWRLKSGVIMPDHVHFVITPVEDRALAVGDFATGFKRLRRQHLVKQNWESQRGCFDRLLRSAESAQEKWLYLEQNPVRAGLVQDVGDWSYYLGSLDGDGKLTASPTGKALV